MRASFDIRKLAGRLAPIKKDPRILVRVLLGVLLAANVISALLLLKPWAASAEEMEIELSRLRQQVKQKQASVQHLQALAKKAAQGRRQSGEFVNKYFLDSRTASSTIISELKDAARQADVQQKEHSFAYEPVDGSDNLSMMTITGSYEGAYENLVRFINLLDRSPRFLILDTLSASPERTQAGSLNVNFKMNVFVISSEGNVLTRGPEAPAA
jgi:type IV pilus assembly protein PilO